MNNEFKVPKYFLMSLLLGTPFLSAWLGFTAMTAKDGREPITDWLDPMLAGLTLLSILFIQVIFIVVWSHIENSSMKIGLTWAFMVSQWFYIFGEILSNTITIGEPPQDIGSLFEIASGVIMFFTSISLITIYLKEHMTEVRIKSKLLVVLSLLLFIGMVWWFTHPINQSQSGTPEYIPGNPVYNFFHRFSQ